LLERRSKSENAITGFLSYRCGQLRPPVDDELNLSDLSVSALLTERGISALIEAVISSGSLLALLCGDEIV